MSVTPDNQPVVPAKRLNSPYPLIDSDPHFKRVVSYARPADWAVAVSIAIGAPTALYVMERFAPTGNTRAAFMSTMRLAGAIGVGGGFLALAARSSTRFYGFRENKREQEMDMREMVAKVKKGEPLYGVSRLDPYMQGVASRNSRYSAVFLHVVPWFNFVNHDQHGVDTAKYYQQAERELEAEKAGK